jgi:hypothetical protein
MHKNRDFHVNKFGEEKKLEYSWNVLLFEKKKQHKWMRSMNAKQFIENNIPFQTLNCQNCANLPKKY